jgi:hypothetical protein
MLMCVSSAHAESLSLTCIQKQGSQVISTKQIDLDSSGKVTVDGVIQKHSEFVWSENSISFSTPVEWFPVPGRDRVNYWNDWTINRLTGVLSISPRGIVLLQAKATQSECSKSEPPQRKF